MPTIVLSDPVAERIKSGGVTPGAGSTAAKIVGPQIKKAIELAGKAREDDRAPDQGAVGYFGD